MGEMLATIVLKYEDGTDAVSSDCIIELDEVLNVDEDGNEKTSFIIGDNAYILAKPADDVRITRVVSTCGDISSFGMVSRDREMEALFVEYNSENSKPTLSYKSSGGISVDWVGNVGGSIKYDLDDLSMDISSGEIPCMGNITISVSFYSFMLEPVVLDRESYNIYVVFYLEKL